MVLLPRWPILTMAQSVGQGEITIPAQGLRKPLFPHGATHKKGRGASPPAFGSRFVLCA